MGEENNQRIYLVKKRVGTSWKLVSINKELLKIKGTEKALKILNQLEELANN